MATNANNIVPAIATHPGSILKKELQARGIKQKDFAQAIGIPAPNLNELIKGKRNITENTAIKLEEALGIPYQNWMNLQNRYQYVVKCRQDMDVSESKALDEEQSLRRLLNMSVLYRNYGINYSSASDRLKALKGQVSLNPEELKSYESKTAGYFKRSDKLKVDEVNMRTWLLLARSEALKAKIVEEYTSEKGLLAATQIAGMANGKTASPVAIAETLRRNGIIYIQVPKLDAAPIDAYSMMADTHPAIVVTYRYNDLDKLVFDVLHELGHILYHVTSDRSFISVENDYSSQSKEEKEADQFANDTLIPPTQWNMIMSARSNSLSPHAVVYTVAKEAEKHGISATIAVARYKHETHCYNIRGYRSPKILG